MFNLDEKIINKIKSVLNGFNPQSSFALANGAVLFEEQGCTCTSCYGCTGSCEGGCDDGNNGNCPR